MPKRFKKISEEVLGENPYWSYKRDVVEGFQGEERQYYYIESRGSVMIIPMLPDGRICLILQHRYLQGKESIEFPAGMIEGDAEPSEAAARELKEETGYVADELIKLGSFGPANASVKDTMHVFLAHVSEQGAQELEEMEDIEVLYRRPDEIDRLVRHDDICDGITLAAWALARSHVGTSLSHVE